MKFCKNLQTVAELSDPAWAPYWINYKMLKKLIYELLVEKSKNNGGGSTAIAQSTATVRNDLLIVAATKTQDGGDQTDEKSKPSSSSSSSAAPLTSNRVHSSQQHHLGKSPGEIAFFTLLNAECKKASYFFGKTQEEFAIREARIRQGISIIERTETMLVPEMWNHLSKSIHRLYKDLLLLETYAIMSFCAFSKILKKHDKVTGRSTRGAFMDSIVSKANFSQYPKLRELIQSAEEMRESVNSRLEAATVVQMREDERVFLDAIRQLNEDIAPFVAEEGAMASASRLHPASSSSASESAKNDDESRSPAENETREAADHKDAVEESGLRKTNGNES